MNTSSSGHYVIALFEEGRTLYGVICGGNRQIPKNGVVVCVATLIDAIHEVFYNGGNGIFVGIYRSYLYLPVPGHLEDSNGLACLVSSK